MFKLIIILNQIKMDKFDKVCDKKSENVCNIFTLDMCSSNLSTYTCGINKMTI